MAVDIDLLNGNNVNNINTNFQRVKDALQETIGGNGDLPNHMNADLDLNSNDLLNVGIIDAEDINIDGINLSDRLQGVIDAKDEAEDARDIAVASALSASTSANSAANSASKAGDAKDVTVAAKEAAVAASEAAGVDHWTDTYADAEAALSGYAEGDVIGVFADETKGGAQVWYRVESGALVEKFASKLDLLVNPMALSPWRKALADAKFSQAAIVVEGDSITVGANANNATTSGAPDKLLWAQRGWVAQLRSLLAQTYGDVGEGMMTFGSDEGRWTHTLGSASAGGPVSTGRSIPVGGKSVASDLTFSHFDFTCMVGTLNSAVHPPVILVDGADATPTKLSDDQRGGVVDSSNWQNRGNATLSRIASRHLQATAAASGALSIQTPSGASGFNVSPGDVLLVTVAAQTNTNAHNFTASIHFTDSGGTDIPSETEKHIGYATTAVGEDTQVSGIIVVPANAEKANLILRGVSTFDMSETIDFKRWDVIPVSVISDQSLNVVRYGADVASGEHDVEVQGPLDGTTEASWFMVRNETESGVAVHRMGKSGSTTDDHVGASYSSATAGNMLATMFDVLPEVALRIVMLGANDFPNQASNSITPAIFKANLQTLIDKQVAMNGCVLLVSGPRYSDDTGLTYGEQEYYDQMHDLASENSRVAYLDTSRSWGTQSEAEALGFMNPSLFGIHPNRSGHGDLARMVLKVLTEETLTFT